MNNDYSQQYPQMYNAMSPMSFSQGAQTLVPVTTVTRKNTQPVVVSREDLINALKTGTNDYKKALAENNTLAAALGKAISDREVENTLAAPTNKGRLESEISPLQAFAGGTLAGFNTYGKISQNAEDTAAKQYDATMKGISAEDSLLSKQEAGDLQNALNNQTVTVEGMEKLNTGKTGTINNEMLQNAITLDNMRTNLEDIGTRFDSSFKNIDEMQKGSTRFGRWRTDALWGIGRTDAEKQAREDFEAWKGSMKNVLVNANRQAGTGSMSDADAARFEQKIGEAKNPAEARNILDSFQARLMQTSIQDLRNGYGQPKGAEDIASKYGATLIQQ
jgi:hypothetical protein